MKPRIDHLVFELTEACNQRCRFCYNYWRDGRAVAPPDFSLARKTLKRLFSQTGIGNLSFSGGEPMTVPRVLDLVLLARLKGASVNLLTNGTLLTDGDIASLRDLGVGAVQIPVLSADPRTHEELTGLPGSWKKATEALRLVAREMPGRACAVLVITKANASVIPETLDFLQDMGVTSVMVNRFNLGGTGLQHAGELVLDRAGLARAFADVETFAAAHPAIRFTSGVCTPLCLLDPAAYPHIRFTSCSIDLSRRPVTVNYKGEVRFCNHSPRVLGNLYDRPIDEILSDPAVMAAYQGVPEPCAACPKWSRCNGGCRAAAEQVYGSFAAIDPVLSLS